MGFRMCSVLSLRFTNSNICTEQADHEDKNGMSSELVSWPIAHIIYRIHPQALVVLPQQPPAKVPRILVNLTTVISPIPLPPPLVRKKESHTHIYMLWARALSYSQNYLSFTSDFALGLLHKAILIVFHIHCPEIVHHILSIISPYVTKGPGFISEFQLWSQQYYSLLLTFGV